MLCNSLDYLVQSKLRLAALPAAQKCVILHLIFNFINLAMTDGLYLKYLNVRANLCIEKLLKFEVF
jgi:hypothetical protein